jgi:hypothetical protein
VYPQNRKTPYKQEKARRESGFLIRPFTHHRTRNRFACLFSTFFWSRESSQTLACRPPTPHQKKGRPPITQQDRQILAWWASKVRDWEDTLATRPNGTSRTTHPTHAPIFALK